MSPQFRFVALVCIAVFAFTAITAVPALALLDAHTPVQALFGMVRLNEPRAPSDAPPLPIAPAADVLASRPPPHFRSL